MGAAFVTGSAHVDIAFTEWVGIGQSIQRRRRAQCTSRFCVSCSVAKAQGFLWREAALRDGIPGRNHTAAAQRVAHFRIFWIVPEPCARPGRQRVGATELTRYKVRRTRALRPT